VNAATVEKSASIRGAKKFRDRAEAEKIANDLRGSVGVLRIVDLDVLQAREVYTVELPHDPALRFARRRVNAGNCFFAGFGE
jgi:hypothetical protein